MILRQDQPSRYAALQCAARNLAPGNLPRERFSSLALTRRARTRVSRRQCGEEQTRSNNGLTVQFDPLQTTFTPLA